MSFSLGPPARSTRIASYSVATLAAKVDFPMGAGGGEKRMTSFGSDRKQPRKRPTSRAFHRIRASAALTRCSIAESIRAGEREGFADRPQDLRRASQRIGVLHTRVVFTMRLADLAVRQQVAQQCG